MFKMTNRTRKVDIVALHFIIILYDGNLKKIVGLGKKMAEQSIY